LKHHDICKLGHVNTHGNTALILACREGMNDVALEMLKHNDICKLDHVNTHGNTALILACEKGTNDVALEMLKHHDICKLGHVNTYGNTALILACEKGMNDVALEMLKHREKCKLDQVNKYGNTALIMAQRNNMVRTVNMILSYTEFIKKLELTPIQTVNIEQHIDMRLNEKINQLYSNEEIKQILSGLDNIKYQIRKISKCGTCVMCLDITNNNTVFIECKHILNICEECIHITQKKCPVCIKPSEIITGCYLLQ